MILFLDYTADKIDASKIAEDKEAPFKNIIRRQIEVIDKLEVFKVKSTKSKEEFKSIYEEIVSMGNKEGNDFIPAVQQEAEEEDKFSAVKFVRLLLGIAMVLSLVQFMFFGG